MAQQYPRSPWYDQKTTAAVTPPRDPADRPPRKKRTGLKITAIVLCALVLAAAGVYVLSDTLHIEVYHGSITPGQTEPPRHSSAPAEGGDYAEDFRDYFSGLYIPPSTAAPDSLLEHDEAKTDFRLALHNAEGREPLSLQALYAACADSVVGIRAQKTAKQSAYFWGSGFIVSEDGYIVTNQHIISGTRLATVVLTDGREFPALLVGEDAQMDIAVLKIDADDLVAVEMGDSSDLTVGDEVAAIGNPLGSTLSGTLTNGIISAIDRSISYHNNTLTLLQTNAAINEGNSGGPLFNMYGQVVGITNMKMSAAVTEVSIEGIGFAIPSATVKAVTDQLIATGKYSRPGLGVTLGAIPADAADHYTLPEGLYVYSVSEGSSAKEQGVRVGDIVTHVNGVPVRTTAEVLAIRDELAVGDNMTLTIFREGKTLDITVELRDLSLLY